MLPRKQMIFVTEVIDQPPAMVRYTEPITYKDYYQSTKASFDSEFIKHAMDYIKANEGIRYSLYKDTGNRWHIGIGHLVTPEELQHFKGRKISEDEIQKIFEKDVQNKIHLIHQVFGNIFDTYSLNLKTSILDGFFRGDLPNSPKTIKLLKQRQFAAASQEYLDNQEYRDAKNAGSGVAKRMERNASIFANET